MKNSNRFAIVAAGFLLAALPLSAHHAFAAEFDGDKPIHFENAVVTKVELINPHSWIHVNVTKPDGSVENWAIECGPPNTLMRGGWNKNSLPVGAEVIVEGYAAKTAPRVANGRNVSLPNGTKLFASGSAPPA